jgi:putative colanic acid biosynthesis glycosyltransferase
VSDKTSKHDDRVDTQSLKVLQMNVRLSEGGAAGVAVNIHNELRRLGHASKLTYGYGPGGHVSPTHDILAATRLTSRGRAAANLTIHGLTGEDVMSPSRSRLTELRQLIMESDVIHLHAMHSYWFRTKTLVDILCEAGTPVVWTAHDHWLMTGRCAQPGDCTSWQTGCGACQNLAAYPPAKMDTTRHSHRSRRNQLARLTASVPTQFVACANWLADDLRSAGMKNVSSVQNSVDLEFWNATDGTKGFYNRPNSVPRVLFMCRDLRDRAKVNEGFLLRLAKIVDLVVVGDNASEALTAAVTLVAATNSRVNLAQVMLRCDALVFLSKVDYFPLTIAEAACSGLTVYAVRSPAAMELAKRTDVVIYEDLEDLVDGIGRRVRIRGTAANSEARKYFAPDRMVNEYIEIYRELLARSR